MSKIGVVILASLVTAGIYHIVTSESSSHRNDSAPQTQPTDSCPTCQESTLSVVDVVDLSSIYNRPVETPQKILFEEPPLAEPKHFQDIQPASYNRVVELAPSPRVLAVEQAPHPREIQH